MNSIVTFYSYKGGVGRSMALANVAVLLARRGLRVLVVDWDLEAPGLERYFAYFDIKPGGPGLLRLCMAAYEGGDADYTKFTSSFECEGRHPVTLLASGREADERYTNNLEAFDWESFFKGGGGAFIETLRDQWRKDFDIVLIDSRTGLSDTGGICTIQLPDIVVAMFTANLQSLYGVRDVMQLAQRARQSLAYDRMPLSVFPLPTRWGVQEFAETQVWLDRVAEVTKEFFDDWLPKGLKPRDVIEAVKIPQVPYFSFGERLAVVEHGTSDPQGMGFAYDKLASFLASDFEKVETLLGEHSVRNAVAASTPSPTVQITSAQPSTYLYDVFFSYDVTTSDLVLDITERLRQELQILRGEEPKTFIDVREIRVGDVWTAKLQEALLRSKIMVAFITPRYFESRFAHKEFLAFRERARLTDKSLVVPVLLKGDQLPDYVREFTWLDLRSLRSHRSAPKDSLELQQKIRELAVSLVELIDEAPAFDPNWQTLSESLYRDNVSAHGSRSKPGRRSAVKRTVKTKRKRAVSAAKTK
jgi:MinD-like ATPase involved in chromosome partitioning or flagellar assembly